MLKTFQTYLYRVQLIGEMVLFHHFIYISIPYIEYIYIYICLYMYIICHSVKYPVTFSMLTWSRAWPSHCPATAQPLRRSLAVKRQDLSEEFAESHGVSGFIYGIYVYIYSLYMDYIYIHIYIYMIHIWFIYSLYSLYMDYI